MTLKLFSVIFTVCTIFQVDSVRLVDLRAPAHVAEGSQALLGCTYDLEGDQLYSVKWYKDDREFYRYVPLNNPVISYFSTAGVNIDMSISSSNVVSLTDLSQESAGLYRCEVSGEAPLFTTVYQEKYISVHLLPKSPPIITGAPDWCGVGDRLVVNCTSPASRPEAQVKWWINHHPAARNQLRGPWYRISVERNDALETIMQLQFTVTKKLLQKGMIALKCQATLAPLYIEETLRIIQSNEYDAEVTPAFSLDRIGELVPNPGTVEDFEEDLPIPIQDAVEVISEDEDLPSIFQQYPGTSAVNKCELIHTVIYLILIYIIM